ncbi:hypothetical protein PR048_020383, partial [Dryococelus australis]
MMGTWLYTVFWDDILEQVKESNETRLDVNTVALALASLTSFIGTKRDSFEECETKAAELADCAEYESETQRKNKISVRLAPLHCVQAPQVELTPSEKFRTRSFLPIIDQFESSLQQRLEAYKLVDTHFGFLNKLAKFTNEEIIVAAQNVVEKYNNDLDDQFGCELILFKDFYYKFQEDNEKNEKFISQENWMCKLLEKKNQDCFPNIEIALRMYSTLMVTNSSGERLRTSMLEDRLKVFTSLSIESDILRQLSYEDIISSFISVKCRRKPISHEAIS